MKRNHYKGNWSKVTLEISTRPSHMTRNGLKQEKFNCNQCNFTFVKIKIFLYTHKETISPEESWIPRSQMQIGPFTFNSRHNIVPCIPLTAHNSFT